MQRGRPSGVFEYNESNYLSRIATEEGQIAVTSNGNTYTPQYYLKDHLGNVRVVINGNGSILQETEYFPFGLSIPRSGNDAVNKYQYNGKEKQPETGYLDYGARMYMPEIGRWGVVDRFSEKYFDFSPFSYGANNPIRFIDMNGDSIIVSQAITSNKDLNKAFSVFANTKQGAKFLANYAAEGQTIAGKQYDKDGKYRSAGVNLTYDAKNLESPGVAGVTKSNISKTGVNFSVTMDTDPGRSDYDRIDTFFHESFTHVDLSSKDYLDDRKLNYSNLSLTNSQIRRAYSTNHYHHIKVADDFLKYKYQSPHLWPAAAMEGLQEANRILKLKMSDASILQKMWKYEGGINFN